jgi:TonB family protein
MDVMPSVDVSSRVSPKFPGFDAIYSLGGRGVLDVTIASNGAITNMYIERTSGHREHDDSALEAVRQWQFTPGSRQGTRVGSVVRIPVNFNPQPSGEAPHNRLWPEAYAHPRYVADSSPIGYSSVDGAFEQVPADAHRSHQGAHPIEQLLVHDAHGQLVQWWIFTDLDTPNAMATRLVFGGTADDPVVAVASLCTRAVVCAARKTETLQGPSFARSP